MNLTTTAINKTKKKCTEINSEQFGMNNGRQCITNKREGEQEKEREKRARALRKE